MKVKEVFEAKYAGGGKGSVEWFFDTFFTLDSVDDIDDNEFQAVFVPKDEFRIESVEKNKVWTIYGIWKEESSNSYPQPFSTSSKINWYIYEGTGYQTEHIDDPRKLTVFYTKQAWPKLTEAKYDDGGSGSLAWFIRNFFEHQPREGDEGKYYRVRDGFQIHTPDGVRIHFLDTWKNKNGDLDWLFLNRYGRSAATVVRDLRVDRVERIWPHD
jgi:hypothetical protein